MGVSEQFPFRISEVQVRAEAGRFGAVVIAPKHVRVTGREQLSKLAVSSELSPVEHELVRTVEARRGACDVVFFRAADDTGRPLWGFDPSLDEEELIEAGYVMCKALLPFHRQLLACGVVQMVHSDWGVSECFAMRRGTQRLIRELGEKQGHRDAVDEANYWIVKHVLLHASLPFDHIVEQLLPTHLPLLDRRRRQIERLVAALPEEEFAWHPTLRAC